jgi:hypothetical protein
MTAAKEKAIRAYLASIPEDEDRKGMMGYRFLITPLRRARISRVAAKKKVTGRKSVHKQR